MISEFALIDKIKKWISRDLQGVIAIGDDAGVLNLPPGEKLVFTADAIVEGVDFHARPSKRKTSGFLSAQMAGRKALAINLSDLAAMGAKPLACVISLGIPKHFKESWVKGFYQGAVALAREFQIKCCGGDLTQSKDFFASVAMTGTARGKAIMTRGGAKPGDWIAVTGSLGGSLKRKHAAFRPRIHEALFLSEKFKPTAMLDISDGLLQDLGHLLKASGTGASLEMLEIPISYDAVMLAKQNPMKAFERACTDGEDFELLFTVSKNKKTALRKSWARHFPRVPLSWIGQMNFRKGKVAWLLNGKKTASPFFKTEGYRHFK